MDLPLLPSPIIEQLRAWFFAKDRSLILADNTFIELPGISTPSTPSLQRQKIFGQYNDSVGKGLYSLDDQGRTRQFDGDIVAWQQAVSNLMLLSGLRGLWVMSPYDESGNLYDVSGNGRTLTYNGNPTYNYDNLVPYIDLDGTGDYLSRSDEAGLDISGTESFVANPGLTLGGWFWADAITGVDGLIGKWLTTGNQRAYTLEIGSATNSWRLLVSQDGSFGGGVSNTKTHSGTFATGQWHHVIGRWNTTNIGIQINGNLEESSAVIASLFNSSADFGIGARSGGTNLLDGRAALCFLCASSLSDSQLSALFQQQRVLFGV